MDVLAAVAEYLRGHWKVCASSRWEREADIRFYEQEKHPYGKAFAEKLRAVLAAELK